MEKVLSGVLTPSTAQTWSKPWRSNTSLPHMPSAHHPPPHPGKTELFLLLQEIILVYQHQQIPACLQNLVWWEKHTVKS